jgi:hypothetical protein
MYNQPPQSLLVKFLRERRTASDLPRAFIIHPTNSRLFAPDVLLWLLLSEQSAQPQLSHNEAISLLDAVHLFPVFDFHDAVQAISAVSDALYRLRHRRPHETMIDLGTPVTAEKEGGKGKERGKGEEGGGSNEAGNNGDYDDSAILLIVEGLDTLAEGVIRKSSPLRGSALLTPALRTLTHLSRTYASVLVVVLVNTSGLGMASYPIDNPAAAGVGGSVGLTSHVRDQQHRGNVGGSLHCVFDRLGTSSLTLPTMLSRALDQGIDTHLLVSTVQGRLIVEVIKDRTGDNIGRWVVWDQTGRVKS